MKPRIKKKKKKKNSYGRNAFIHLEKPTLVIANAKEENMIFLTK